MTPLTCRKAGKAVVEIKHGHTDGIGPAKLSWKWAQPEGAATDFSDFGDPVGSSSYQICIYDGRGLVLAASAQASNQFWHQLGGASSPRGFRYTNTDKPPILDAGSLRTVTLRAGVGKKARITARGKGIYFLQPAANSGLLQQDTNVIVQLQRDDNPNVCWEAVYEAPPLVNSIDRFKDIFNLKSRKPLP